MTHILRHSPTRNIRSIQKEIDRTVGNIFPALGLPNSLAWKEFSNEWLPTFDAIDTDSSIVIEMELPGINKSDIELSINEDVLTIKGERTKRELAENESFVRSERLSGSFTRSIKLTSEIDSKAVSARFENGVLFVELVKAEESKPLSIKIS